MRFAAGAERATAPRAGWRRVGRRTIRHGKWPGHAVRPASRKTETLSEIRLFITTTEKNAEAILSLMTDAFEDEGYAIATMEIDEKRDIWEASLYLMADEEEETFPATRQALRMN